MVSRMYYDELADFLTGMADEILLEKVDPDVFESKNAVVSYNLAMKASTSSYNIGLDKASKILQNRASKLREQ